MALIKCRNCGKYLLTQSDKFIYQSRPQGEYYSCGCAEFAPYDMERAALLELITDICNEYMEVDAEGCFILGGELSERANKALGI